MRVTKAIREYVEEEIRKKYNEAERNIGAEYQAEKDHVIETVTKIMDKAEGEALEYLKLVGFNANPGYRSTHLFNLSGCVSKKEVEDEIWKQKDALRKRCNDKIRQILFDLEMGETGKAQLKEVLDKVTVD